MLEMPMKCIFNKLGRRCLHPPLPLRRFLSDQCLRKVFSARWQAQCKVPHASLKELYEAAEPLPHLWKMGWKVGGSNMTMPAGTAIAPNVIVGWQWVGSVWPLLNSVAPCFGAFCWLPPTCHGWQQDLAVLVWGLGWMEGKEQSWHDSINLGLPSSLALRGLGQVYPADHTLYLGLDIRQAERATLLHTKLCGRVQGSSLCICQRNMDLPGSSHRPIFNSP